MKLELPAKKKSMVLLERSRGRLLPTLACLPWTRNLPSAEKQPICQKQSRIFLVAAMHAVEAESSAEKCRIVDNNIPEGLDGIKQVS